MDLHQANDLLEPGYLPFESGYANLGDGRNKNWGAAPTAAMS
jgi:hypothetical protein